MKFDLFIAKVKKYLWAKLVHYTYGTSIYPYIYRSYWHYKFSKEITLNTTCYYTARPNPGAGIGHQMANWIAGYWWTKQFGLKFAHIPFSSQKWDSFLGFGESEIETKELLHQGYKKRKLPLFKNETSKEFDLNKKIIQSYAGKKIVFVAEQDQPYQEQYGIMEVIKEKFYNAPIRTLDKLIYSKDDFNIAIHVRRGDIMSDLTNPGLAKRYLSNDYFEKVLSQVLNELKVSKPIHIYFFSQGKPEDYPEFQSYPNLHWCMNMGAQDSFLHMVYADLLITSKSSFSYKPALLNNGIKISPRNFWHGYPNRKDWILCENDGSFNIDQLKNLIHE